MGFVNKNTKPQERLLTVEEQKQANYKYYLSQLKAMEPFTFRSFNYIYNDEDRMYYPYYEMELFKQNKGKKPKGMTTDRYYHFMEQEKKYNKLIETVKKYEAEAAAQPAAQENWEEFYPNREKTI